MSKRNQILAGILALQLVLVAVVFWPRRAASGAVGKSLFPGLEPDRIAKLTISDAQGQTIQLTRQPNGWVLLESEDYPCTADTVSTFLGKLTALKTDRLVTQTSGSHKRLRVAEGAFECKVEFELSDGTKHRLYLGTSASGTSSHMRADDQNEVYLSGNLSSWDVSTVATGWIDTIYWSVPQDQLVAMTLENANGRFELNKDAAGGWTLKGLAAGETLDTNSVQGFVSQAASISLSKPLGKQEKPEYGMQQPGALLTLQTQKDQESKTYTLRIGAKDKDNNYTVKSSESAYYVSVSEWAVQAFVEKTRNGFLQLPATPAATPQN